MLDQKMLEIIVCPKCKNELEYLPNSDDDRQGKLICRVCNLAYSVQDDIPILLIEQAKPHVPETPA